MTTFKDMNLNSISSTSGLLDAFGRLRISDPATLIDTKQLYDDLPLVYDDSEVSGGSTTSTHSLLTASTDMGVALTTAGVRTRQTFRRFNYQTGKSHLIMMTGILNDGGASLNSDNFSEIGYFDDDNGVFFSLNGSTLSTVVRGNMTGSAVDSSTAQSAWNVDKMDGTGISKITIDTTKTQIFFVDLEWLGVGTVAYGFVVNRMLYYCHFANHANLETDVYMSTPNLPVRYQIRNVGTGVAATLKHICSTVISEGGQDKIGVLRALTRGSTLFSNAGDSVICPLLSIKLKATHIGATIDLLDVSVLATAAADYEVLTIFNPTIAGVDQASWVNETNGALQYDISRDNTNTLTAGTIMSSDWVAQSNSQGGFSASIDSAQLLGSAIDGTVDEIVLAVRNQSGSNKSFRASIGTRQLI